MEVLSGILKQTFREQRKYSSVGVGHGGRSGSTCWGTSRRLTGVGEQFREGAGAIRGPPGHETAIGV